ncbi:hypothetical protein H310_10279 [Aphanomyces invadans]|uniref:Uncharacterized protein n=1 Tax=Aphanomyces invadans TaxID=157072 RepID=A0A024TRC8_9STRA|nr:hypothetical protein H310_10279 [Aphanomyces invadans]ETV96578.1 hypothetical protein H310_10279 [Aphanomyces invadans]|eukprot:XP_008874841.1 hypothetical protein H310_10279 [Aphanomyces invadans]
MKSTKPTTLVSARDENKSSFFVIGADQNDFIVGKWSTGLLGCINARSMPTGCMVTFCPCVSLAQIAHRVGMYKYWTVICTFVALFLVYIGMAALESTVSKCMFWRCGSSRSSRFS